MRNGLPEYDGKKVFDANQPIVELLKKRGVLLHTEKLEHSYPHCWRCHNPIIFRATEQWFISMETPMPGGTLRSRTLDEIKKVKWDPAWGEERISNMIATRPDWCISRQRIWGVPIAVFLCEGCGKPLNDPAVNRKVIELFARDGADAWYTPEADALLPAGTKCATVRRHEVQQRNRHSGRVVRVRIQPRRRARPRTRPALARRSVPRRRRPVSRLVPLFPALRRGHARTRLRIARWLPMAGRSTNKGRAMSKSLGNDVDPVDIANRMGGEIVRLWVASVDFREDVVGSEHLMQRVAENYRKIRNTCSATSWQSLRLRSAKDAVPFDEAGQRSTSTCCARPWPWPRT